MTDADGRLAGTPFVGLVPYGEEDAAFFFGRGEEQEIVTGNLRATRLTILYGASGVGKTSLLHAGVVHDLHEQVRANAAGRPGRTPFAVCAFSAWRVDPLRALVEPMRAACVEALGGEELPPWRPGQPLVEAVRAWTDRVRPLLVVLDQFEDYFLYHPDDDGEGTFAVEFPRLVNELNLRVNFVVSLREDAWAKLDRFEGRIPALFANYVRVEHLDRKAAREAIEGPVGEWNRRLPLDAEPYEVEPALVEAVIEAAAAGTLALTEGGAGPEPASADGVEAPFLQLVLDRLWRATIEVGSHTLDLARLETLGGANQIVKNHLLEALGKLTPGEQSVAADLFRFLVTRSRTKIAHQASDLADWTKRPEPEVTAVLDKLCRGESGRILRSISPPAGETAASYELFHDVLAEPILEWRRHYEQERARRLALKRFARIGGVLLSLIAVFAALGVWALVQRGEAKRATKAAVVQQRAAERATRSALAQRRAAQRATRSATSLALASASRDQLVPRLDASLLLGLAAYEENPSAQSRSAMIAALEAARRSGLRGIVEGHTDAVRSIAFSGQTLAVARNDGTVTLWDTRTGRSRRLPPGQGSVTSLAFGPGGKTLAAARGATLELWDVPRRRLLRPPLPGQRDGIQSVAFSPDGRTVAAGGGEYHPTVVLWDVRTGKQRGGPLAAHKDFVFTVAFSPDGHTLVSASNDQTVRLWNVRTHQQLGETLSGDRAVLSPDGRALALTSGPHITLWDLRSRTQVGRIISGWLAAFSPDGRTLASATGETLRLWDAHTGRQLGAPLRGHTNTISTIAFAPDGRTLASAGYDGTVRVWNVRPRTRLGRLLPGHSSGVRTVGFTPDGHTLASAGLDGVRLVDVRTGRQLGRPLPGQRGFFSPNGRSIVTSNAEWTAHRYDVRTRRRIGRPMRGYAFAFSPNGRMLASGTSAGTVLWDARTQRKLGRPLRGFVPAFSPDRRILATGGNDGKIRLWDLRTRKEIGHPWSGGHAGVTEAVAFSPDGRTLASAGDDQTVRFWDVRTGTQLGRPLRGHLHVVSSVAFSRDGRTLASTSFDGTVRLWDVASHAQLGEALGEPADGNAFAEQGASVAFSPDGRTFASGGIDGKVRLWEGILWRTPRDLRKLVCGRLVLGQLTRPEWEELVSGLPYRAICPG